MAGKIQKAAAQKGLDKGKEQAQPTLRNYIKSMQGEIAKALPSVMTPERFTRITLSALATNPKLCETTPSSFLGAMMTAAQLGMEPNTPLGQAYLIPFKNKGKLECQFQLGYKGLIDLAYRSGEVSVIEAHTVYEDDHFEYELGLEPNIKHVPSQSADKGSPIFFYAMFKTKDGGYGFEVMSIEDVRAHAKKYSQSFNSSYSPWSKNFEEMAKKTVLKKALKYAPLKSEFVRGITVDETVKKEISEDMFATPSLEVEYEIDEDGVVQEEKPASGEMTEEEKQQIIEMEKKEVVNE